VAGQKRCIFFNIFLVQPILVIETILKTLTAAGAFLGTVAFVQNLSKEVTTTNKAQWEKLVAIIGPADFDELQYVLTTDRIRLAIREKIHALAYPIGKETTASPASKVFSAAASAEN